MPKDGPAGLPKANVLVRLGVLQPLGLAHGRRALADHGLKIPARTIWPGAIPHLADVRLERRDLQVDRALDVHVDIRRARPTELQLAYLVRLETFAQQL